MYARISKGLFAVFVFAAIMAGGWWFGFIGQGGRHLPDDRSVSSNCTLWFVGSSSIRRWSTLGSDMAPWAAHNRGIDGANFSDILPRFGRSSPARGRPAAIILYAGENDIASGREAGPILRDLARFAAERDRLFPDVPLLVLSMKPSPGRAQYFAQQRAYDTAVRTLLPTLSNAVYVDITTPLLANGMPADHYQADGIHMSHSGYVIWADVVRSALERTLPASSLTQCGVVLRSAGAGQTAG